MIRAGLTGAMAPRPLPPCRRGNARLACHPMATSTQTFCPACAARRPAPRHPAPVATALVPCRAYGRFPTRPAASAARRAWPANSPNICRVDLRQTHALPHLRVNIRQHPRHYLGARICAGSGWPKMRLSRLPPPPEYPIGPVIGAARPTITPSNPLRQKALCCIQILYPAIDGNVHIREIGFFMAATSV